MNLDPTEHVSFHELRGYGWSHLEDHDLLARCQADLPNHTPREVRPGVLVWRMSTGGRVVQGRAFICQDCRVPDPDCPMVLDWIWHEAGLNPSPHAGIICQPCLEARLGRQLVRQDLMDVPYNKIFHRLDAFAWMPDAEWAREIAKGKPPSR